MVVKIIRIFKLFLLPLGIVVILLSLVGCQSISMGMLKPAGLIAFQERELFFDSLALMLIVVIPVIIMSLAFVVRYRETHKTAEYAPDWSHDLLLEAIWWGVPCAIIVVLGVMTWKLTHKLDPYQKINVAGKPLLVQAVALPWKWLFVYPEYQIATVNFLELPIDRQVEFWLTTDNVPMSAFFIPELGSQIYTMAGMKTRLHLLPTQLGTFQGLNSQYNVDGFSDMHFTVSVVDSTEMNKWVHTIQRLPTGLNQQAYQTLRDPSKAVLPQYYSSVEPNLFMSIIRAYRAPSQPQKIIMSSGNR